MIRDLVDVRECTSEMLCERKLCLNVFRPWPHLPSSPRTSLRTTHRPSYLAYAFRVSLTLAMCRTSYQVIRMFCDRVDVRKKAEIDPSGVGAWRSPFPLEYWGLTFSNLFLHSFFTESGSSHHLLPTTLTYTPCCRGRRVAVQCKHHLRTGLAAEKCLMQHDLPGRRPCASSYGT